MKKYPYQRLRIPKYKPLGLGWKHPATMQAALFHDRARLAGLSGAEDPLAMQWSDGTDVTWSDGSTVQWSS